MEFIIFNKMLIDIEERKLIFLGMYIYSLKRYSAGQIF